MANVTAPQFQQDVNNTADWANGDENTTVTMRLGQQADSPAKVIKRVDDLAAAQREDIYENATPLTIGNFTDGFTYTALNQRGEFGGDQYVFLGGLDGLPHVVAPATDPTLSPSLYAKANYNDAASVANANGGNVQNQLDIKDGLTVTEAINYAGIASLLGSRVWLTDRHAWFDIVLSSSFSGDGDGMDELTSDVDVSYGLKLDTRNDTIKVVSLGYKADEIQDNSNIVQRADDLAVSTFLQEVTFPHSDKDALCSATINKSDATVWRKSGPNSRSNGLPLGLKFTNNGRGVNVQPTGQTTFYGAAGFYGLGLSNSETNLAAYGVYNDVSGTPGAAREQTFADLKIAGFVAGNLYFNGGGTNYFRRVFSYRSEKSLWMNNTSDCWFYACHFGSGKAFTNPNSVNTYGVYAVGSNGCDNLSFTACRFQECINGVGFRGEGLHRSNFTDCFWDGNDLGGMDLGDFEDINITGGRMFRNGTTASKKYGLLLFSTAGNSASGLTIQGKLFSQDFGGVDERQDKGISFVNSGNGLSNIQIIGVDTEKLDTPLANLNNAQEVEIVGCSKKTLPKFQTLGDSNLSWNYGYNGYHVRQNVTLTADRDLTLNVGASPTGFTVKVIRTSGGAFNFNVRSGVGTLLKALAQNEWAEFAYNGTAYELIQTGTL